MEKTRGVLAGTFGEVGKPFDGHDPAGCEDSPGEAVFCRCKRGDACRVDIRFMGHGGFSWGEVGGEEFRALVSRPGAFPDEGPRHARAGR